MAAQPYSDGLKELRSLRDEVTEAVKARDRAQRALDKAITARDKKVKQLGAYEQAKAERIAPAAGLSVKDVVDLVPALGPQPAAAAPATPDSAPAAEKTPPQESPAVPERTGATPPSLQQVQAHQPSRETTDEDGTTRTAPDEPAAEQPASGDSSETETPAPAGEPRDEAPASEPVMRTLPSVPEGPEGDRWFAVAPNLVSEHPNFTQKVRPAVFLDATTGALAFRDRRIQLDLGSRSAAEILTAVYATVPESVERIYITAGDPWHRDADRHRYLKDAVAAWLDAPLPEGWKVDTGRGKDDLAGHYVHERKPVGRWQRGNLHTEIRSVTEWFDPEGADVTVIRQAFVLTLQALQKEKPTKRFPDAVLMGSPSQTGRDLWSRTISTKKGSRWADGYPVMSAEIRQLLHATSGQGRTELITPPRISEELPQWTELDRTLAYGKHTWTSGVGAPRRITAHAFDSMSEKDKTNALFAPSHWQVRVTIPDDWDHVGLLPAAVEGDRSWIYPHEGGRTFVTWAGGAEINAALRNPIQPWKIEILDGLLWEAGAPLREWSDKLKDAWAELASWARAAGTDELRQAYKLASRAVRSILLYGIGSFAQRPRVTTGTVQRGHEREIPKGAHVVSMEGDTIVWERTSVSRNPWAHPEWSAGVWSAARAALLSTGVKNQDGTKTHIGALHLPPGSIVAFRTDAIYTSDLPNWPYNGDPGDYLLKGHLPYPVAAPTNEQEFYGLQANGRAWLNKDATQ
ncbi:MULTISPECIES: hypothetical protein [unclassified Streptomyces]|uniref:Mucin-19 n=1 Tax=Streptomyces sp. F12 TaxID=1436084 RepID=V9Z7A7_9ACTN|nr:hypothetical protein [Streptomyces sp. F12]AHE40417.1 Hypothetical protein pFRL6_330 [Streptomyces sp. F12]